MEPEGLVALRDAFPEGVWVFDFEYQHPEGCRPTPVCFAALDILTGREIRQWQGEFGRHPPFPVGKRSLAVTYFGTGDLQCFRALGWEPPCRLIDVYVEVRRQWNGHPGLSHHPGLLESAAAYGICAMTGAEKTAGRSLVIRGGPWMAEERRAVLDYCAADVTTTARVFGRLWPLIRRRRPSPTVALGHALLRGRYVVACSAMEWTGIPVDVPLWRVLRDNWVWIKGELVEAIDPAHRVYDAGGGFSHERFARFLASHRISWPRTPTGRFSVEDATWKDMARVHPELIGPLRELRTSLEELKLASLSIGDDGRNRVFLSPFGSVTGRNTPSNSRGIFGPSTWVRSLIRPSEGKALAYLDWSGQEIAIAGVLSGDDGMVEAYCSGDFYTAFAKRARLVPPSATKESHPGEREKCKTAALGTNYGMRAFGLSLRLGVSRYEAAGILDGYSTAFPRYWRWVGEVVDTSMLAGRISTVFGWEMHVHAGTKPLTLRNYLMQATGAEMMRLAAIYATEDGLAVCCPIHDAFLIEAPLADIEEHVTRMRGHMARASRDVLKGFEVRVDAKVVRYPDRYADERGRRMWEVVMGLLSRLPPLSPMISTPITDDTPPYYRQYTSPITDNTPPLLPAIALSPSTSSLFPSASPCLLPEV